MRPEGHVVLKRAQELVEIGEAGAALLQHHTARQHDLFEPRGGRPDVSGDSILDGEVVVEGPGGTVRDGIGLGVQGIG